MEIYLPAEIWWEITGYLDFVTLIKLRCVNWYFNSLVSYRISIGDVNLCDVYVPPRFNRLLMDISDKNVASAYIIACRYFMAGQFVGAWKYFDKYFRMGGKTMRWSDMSIIILDTVMYMNNGDVILVIVYIHTHLCKHLRVVIIDQDSQYDVIPSVGDLHMIVSLVRPLFPNYDLGRVYIVSTGCKSYRKECPNEFSLYIDGWLYPLLLEEEHPYIV